jgi:8-oxo-dGTP diphosphatase
MGSRHGDHLARVGAVAVICDGPRALLSHRRDVDLWDLPGGAVEVGETPWEAAVREAEEETGLRVEVERLTGVYGKRVEPELVLVFRCRRIGGQIRPTPEADRHAWTALEDLPVNFSPNQAERLRDALTTSEVVLRTQRGYTDPEWEAWLATVTRP